MNKIDYFNGNEPPEIMHLYLLSRCRHKCPMCCNNLYDIDNIPIPTIEELKTVHTLCFTGGEPFLVENLAKLATKIKKQYPNIETIYSYTSGLSLLMYMKRFDNNGENGLESIDGITISPKDKLDWSAARTLLTDKRYRYSLKKLSSNRLYFFTDDNDSYNEYVKDVIGKSNFKAIERYWDNKFKTPENEIFRRLPILLDK